MPLPYTAIGVIGPIYSGKSTVAEVAANTLKYRKFSHSTLLMEIAKDRNIDPIERDTLFNIYKELYYSHGADIMARRTIERVGSRFFVVDGIRNSDEVEFYRKNTNIFFIAVDVSPERDRGNSLSVRKERALSKPRYADKIEEFESRDALEWGLVDSVYSVEESMRRAHVHLTNGSSEEAFRKYVLDILMTDTYLFLEKIR